MKAPWGHHEGATDQPRRYHGPIMEASWTHHRGTIDLPRRHHGPATDLPWRHHDHHAGTTDPPRRHHEPTMETSRPHRGRNLIFNGGIMHSSRRRHRSTMIIQWRYQGSTMKAPRTHHGNIMVGLTIDPPWENHGNTTAPPRRHHGGAMGCYGCTMRTP